MTVHIKITEAFCTRKLFFKTHRGYNFFYNKSYCLREEAAYLVECKQFYKFFTKAVGMECGGSLEQHYCGGQGIGLGFSSLALTVN